MIKIKFDKDIEPENQKEIEHYLLPFKWLIPGWCQQLTISVFGENGQAAMSTEIHYEYRWAKIDVYGCWFTQDRETKQDNVIHELLHVNISPMLLQCRRALHEIEDEKLRDYLNNEISLVNESITQDLAYSIHKQFECFSGAVNVNPELVTKYTNGEAVRGSNK